MGRLSRFLQGMDRVTYPGHVFHYTPDLLWERPCVGAFLDGKGKFELLEEPNSSRALYLLRSKPAVLKHNRLQGWKRLIRRNLGFIPAGDYCLSNEFVNLCRLANSELVPKVYGFGYRRRGLLCDEYLLIEFLSEMQTVDDFMADKPDAYAWVILQVVDLFFRMLEDGFVHMDPHPKNIMLGAQGGARFIDLECCVFDSDDPDFVLAFALGYFFHFWFSRFVKEKCYDELVLGLLLERNALILNDRFLCIYQHFKAVKVSRKVRFEALVSRSFRRRFERTNNVSHEVLQKLKAYIE